MSAAARTGQNIATQVPHVGDRDPTTWIVTCWHSGTHQQEAKIGSRAHAWIQLLWYGVWASQAGSNTPVYEIPTPLPFFEHCFPSNEDANCSHNYPDNVYTLVDRCDLEIPLILLNYFGLKFVQGKPWSNCFKFWNSLVKMRTQIWEIHIEGIFSTIL